MLLELYFICVMLRSTLMAEFNVLDHGLLCFKQESFKEIHDLSAFFFFKLKV